MLLKSLALAQAAADNIQGVIRGTSINHGGRTHGYTVPNPHAQADLVIQALRDAHVDPRQVSYVEAHGTGTVLGDPIEIAGLSKAFAAAQTGNDARVMPAQAQYCAIGSVKTNIGHLEAAAGIAGLTKVLLQMKHQTLVPSLHARVLNPNIDLAGTPFFVQRELGPWQRPGAVTAGESRPLSLIAGVSSFGAGGANAHVIVEEYQQPSRNALPHETVYAVPLSAATEAQLLQKVRDLVDFLDSAAGERVALADIAFTLQVGREDFGERLGVLASDRADLRRRLADYLARGAASEEVRRGRQQRPHRVAAPALATDVHPTRGTDDLLADWLQGGSVDWAASPQAAHGRRVSLPLYPIERRKYPIKYDQEREILKPRGAAPAPAAAATPAGEGPAAPRNGKIHLSSLRAAVPGPRPPSRVLAPLVAPSAAPSPSPAVRPIVKAQASAPAHAGTGLDATALRRDLLTSLERVLLMEPGSVDEHCSFIELGLDSVLGVEWVQAINRQHGTQFPTTVFYDHPTFSELCEHITKALAASRKQALNGASPVEALLEQLYNGAIDIDSARSRLTALTMGRGPHEFRRDPGGDLQPRTADPELDRTALAGADGSSGRVVHEPGRSGGERRHDD